MSRPPVVLCIGGTDPLCGAGTVADALHVAELGGWPLSIETTSVQQDSAGVRSIRLLDPSDVAARVRLAIDDARPDAVKVGMLGGTETATAVREELARLEVPVVLDPVLASGGDVSVSLETGGLAAALLDWARLPRVLLTPNLSEAAALAGAALRRDKRAAPQTIDWVATHDARRDAAALERLLGLPLLLKGGHRAPPGRDVLSVGGDCTVFDAQGAWPVEVHGTGCALATAIAVGAAKGRAWSAAVAQAKRWLDAVARDPARVQRVGRGRHQIVPPAPR